VSFNNDSSTSLTDVQGVLESALKRLQGQPSTHGNVESQATQFSAFIPSAEWTWVQLAEQRSPR
jgi:hypothetical protein